MMTVRISATGDVFPLLQYVRKIEMKMHREEMAKKKAMKKRRGKRK
jgi:hypothetical protein